MPFAPVVIMSKQNDTNPNYYKEGDRNHQGEGILQDEHKRNLKETEKKQGQQGEKNFIPGEAPVGEKSDK